MTTLNADDTGFLRGRTAMVSGGASGIGLAIADGLARAGADVAIGSLLASSGSRLLPDQATHMPGADGSRPPAGVSRPRASGPSAWRSTCATKSRSRRFTGP